jgi:hypothetical protein
MSSPLYQHLQSQAKVRGMECFVHHVDAHMRTESGLHALDVQLQVFGTIEQEAAFRRDVLVPLDIAVYEVEHRRHP